MRVDASMWPPAAAPPAARPSRRAHERTGKVIKAVAGAAATALTVLVAVLATLLVVAAVASRFSADGQYTVFGHPVLVVLSGSMAPAVNTGDLIVDDPVSPEQAAALQPGQVITFLTEPRGGKGITHRIVDVRRLDSGAVAYVTRGDANNAADQEPVPAGLVAGVLRARVPYAGYVLAAVHQPLVLALLGLAAVLWLVSDHLRRLAAAQPTDRRNT